MISYHNSVKKCPECKEWSPWQGGPEERCAKCNEYLDPKAAEDQQKETERIAKEGKKGPVSFIVEIKPDDNLLIVTLKRLVQFGQLVFMAIVSFLLWLAAIVTG